MLLVVVFIFEILASVEPSCINKYTSFINEPKSPINIRENVLEIPSQYYIKCSALSAVTLNAFGHDVKLTSLDFVKYFPPSVAYLDASNNNITEIPAVNTVRLKTLILVNNKIEDVNYVSGFRYLEVLDVSYNKIVYLPEIKLPNLNILYLRKNFIVSISSWNLHASPKLSTLQLDENALVELRLCRFENEITIKIRKNPKFSYRNLVCNRCVCRDDFERRQCGRLTDVCAEEMHMLYLYIIVGLVAGIAVFIIVCLVGLLFRGRRTYNRRLSPASEDSKPISRVMASTRLRKSDEDRRSLTDDEKVASKSLPSDKTYDYVYDHMVRSLSTK